MGQFGWETFKTDDGETYYFNTKDEKSVWELPEEVKEELIKHLNSKASQEEASDNKQEVSEQPVVIKDSSGNGKENNIDWEQEHNQANVNDTSTEESEANQLIGLKDLLRKHNTDKEHNKPVGISSTKNEEETERMNEDQQEDISKKGFLSMLDEKKVELDWPFAKVTEECIDDNRYWQIEDPLQRKQLFEVYLIGKREAEYKKVQESRQKYMEQFRLILEKHDIKSYTRWKTCESEISEEKVCMSIPKDLQKQFFRNYVQELKDEERKQRDERRKSQLSRLEEETTAVVKVNSKFEELIKVIDFAKKYPDLNKVDVITIFETTMMKRMDEFKKVVAKSKKKNERADRKARESFKAMLKHKEKEYPQKFTANMKWYEFLNLIRDEESFIKLCGHNGSSAIDYYWDIIDAKNQVLRTKVDFCMRLMNSKHLQLKSFHDDVDKFSNALKKVIAEQESKIDIADIELTEIFEVLKRREEEEKARKSKKRTLDETLSANKKQKLPRLGYGVLQ